MWECAVLIILGIDPGFGIVGYGVIKAEHGNYEVLDYGVIETPKNERLPVRLAMIESCTKQLLARYNPDEIAVEELFFTKTSPPALRLPRQEE